ncbi:MAG: MobA/MobL family protein [Alphaproteobacteria bacterium]|nr:MobA/MobL family protein [Alphaproteobacteria bacterium]
MHVKIISRKGSSGGARSVVASAAYRAGERLHDERAERDWDYTAKGHVAWSEVMLPAGAPDRLADRETLWNEVEATEKRFDAQLARDLTLTIERDLPHADQIEAVKSFVQEQFVSRGMIADVAIHRPLASDGREQPHAHVLLTMREVSGDTFASTKARDWNGLFVDFSHGRVAGSSPLQEQQQKWADVQNHFLARAGVDTRVDNRSLSTLHAEAVAEGAAHRAAGRADAAHQAEARATTFDREPEPKIGAAALALERRGLRTEVGDRWWAAMEQNAERASIREQLGAITSTLADWWEGATVSLEKRLAEIADRAADTLQAIQGRFERMVTLGADVAYAGVGLDGRRDPHLTGRSLGGRFPREPRLAYGDEMRPHKPSRVAPEREGRGPSAGPADPQQRQLVDRQEPTLAGQADQQRRDHHPHHHHQEPQRERHQTLWERASAHVKPREPGERKEPSLPWEGKKGDRDRGGGDRGGGGGRGGGGR